MTETLTSLPSISRNSHTQSSANRPSSRSNTQSRDAFSRPSTLGSKETPTEATRRECLTSLSALYRSSYKPYQFTHMYGTHYNKTFQGRLGPPPQPERQATARYAPINYSSLKTTYQQEFRDKEPIAKPLILPCSRHRKNKPHPNLTITWQYPNNFRWIWSGKSPEQRFLGTIKENQNGDKNSKSTGNCFGRMQDMRMHTWCSR